MDDRIVDRALCAAAAVLGVALFAAAVVHLSAPAGVQAETTVAVAAPPQLVPPRPLAKAARAALPPRAVRASRRAHRTPKPIARVALAEPQRSAKHSVASRMQPPLPARKPVRRRPLGHSHGGPRIDPNATPEPPVGYDPHPAIAGADIVADPPSADAPPSAPVSFRAPSHGR